MTPVMRRVHHIERRVQNIQYSRTPGSRLLMVFIMTFGECFGLNMHFIPILYAQSAVYTDR